MLLLGTRCHAVEHGLPYVTHVTSHDPAGYGWAHDIPTACVFGGARVSPLWVPARCLGRAHRCTYPCLEITSCLMENIGRSTLTVWPDCGDWLGKVGRRAWHLEPLEHTLCDWQSTDHVHCSICIPYSGYFSGDKIFMSSKFWASLWKNLHGCGILNHTLVLCGTVSWVRILWFASQPQKPRKFYPPKNTCYMVYLDSVPV